MSEEDKSDCYSLGSFEDKSTCDPRPTVAQKEDKELTGNIKYYDKPRWPWALI